MKTSKHSSNNPPTTLSYHSISSKSVITPNHYIDPYVFNSFFPNTYKIHHSITRCKRSHKNNKPYKCYQYWCSHCSQDETDRLIDKTISFSSTLTKPAFATILLKFIASPHPNVWKKEINKTIKLIDLPGLWFPEIAFKKDKVLEIADKGYGYDKDHQCFLHLHGIMDLKDYRLITKIFDKFKQHKIEEIGKGTYAAKSWERNIFDIVTYSTKKGYLKADRAIIEMNPTGFGYRITKRQ